MTGIIFLDVPYDQRMQAKYLGARYDGKRKTWYIPSDGKNAGRLSSMYGTQDFTFQRWLEDDFNRTPKPIRPGGAVFKPKPHQEEAGKRILKAWQSGSQGFLISDGTGLGKTLSTLYGTELIAKAMRLRRKLKLLIVCPKAVIPSWRQTLRSYPPAANIRALIINYQSMSKLIKPPASARKAKTIRTRNRRIARSGTPKISFDVIIFDEEQYLKNYGASAMSMAAGTIAGLDTAYRKRSSPFVISSTATPGTNPMELAIMAPWLSTLIDPKDRRYTPPKNWGRFLKDHGFSIRGKASSLAWRGSDKDMKRDVATIGRALATPGAPYIMRTSSDIAGWPEQQVIPVPMDIGAQGMVQYMMAWDEFRQAWHLARKRRDKQSPLVAALRFRQKSSIIKAPSIADFAVESVHEGKQVFIGCEFVETMDIIEHALDKARIPYSEYSGRLQAGREQARMDFQTGKTKVVLCTSVEGVSFHAGESLQTGGHATSADRVTIIADVRSRVLDTQQQMGRCHRDGRNSICYLPYAEDTIDRKTIETFARRIRNMDLMTGNRTGSDYLDAMIGELESGS